MSSLNAKKKNKKREINKDETAPPQLLIAKSNEKSFSVILIWKE